MNDSAKPVCSNAAPFSHIYVETGAFHHPRTGQILNRFPDATVIECRDYKEIFSRPHQNPYRQRPAQALILAISKQPAIHPGAAVCQSFGNTHFYYTSNVMNCVFDCEYCYLQGMYPGSHMVVFVNLEDTLEKIGQMLCRHPMYVSISYDTDLLAIEPLTGFLSEWCCFAAAHPTLSIEIRTKAAAIKTMRALPVLSNVIWAFTLSPDDVIRRYEHKTPALASRLTAAKAALTEGRRVRLCFDPMLLLPDWKNLYRELFQETFRVLPPDQICDISLGVFRISKDYLKNMRKNRPCGITAYPYELTDGVYHYGVKKTGEMLGFAREELKRYVSEEKIFLFEF